MDDQTFLNQLAEKLSKLGTVRPLGFHYLHPYGTVPADSIICNGATYSRALYKDFFDYITTQGWVKTEAEWQEIATRDNGFCPFYSSGDGSTNFRTPKFAPYQQIAVDMAQATTYSEAGLPNISGSFNSRGIELDSEKFKGTGCFYWDVNFPFTDDTSGHQVYPTKGGIGFSARAANKVYGKSDTVQPEAHSWVMCVVAYGVATNVGSVDMADVLTTVAQVQTELGTAVKSVNGQKPNNAGNVTIEVKSAMPNYSSYVQVSKGDFTPTYDGWIRLFLSDSSDFRSFTVKHKESDQVILNYAQTRYPGSGWFMCPLVAGETYTISSSESAIYFHPMR